MWAEKEKVQSKIVEKKKVEPEKVESNIVEEKKVEPSKNENVFKDWLTLKCRNKGTQHGYAGSILIFLQAIYGKEKYPNSEVNYNPTEKEKEERIAKLNDAVVDYLNEKRDFAHDFNVFIKYLNDNAFAPKTTHARVSMVKKFFSRQGLELTEQEWEDFRELLAPNKARTQDKILTKEQMRKVLPHLREYMRALALFLVSTGARVGETLQLKMEDLELDHDPPQVNIRPQYTKKEVGGRIMWFTPEAKEALIEWFKIKDSLRKKTGEPFPKDMVFGFKKGNAEMLWLLALKDAGLDQRDNSTKERQHLYHIYTLRKFFKTNMTYIAKLPTNVVDGWMGHSAYLSEAYDRPQGIGADELYKKHMDVVTIYAGGDEAELKQFRDKLEVIEKENKQKADELSKVDELLDKMGVPNHRPREERLLEFAKMYLASQTESSQPPKSEVPNPIQVTQTMPIVKDSEPQEPKRVVIVDNVTFASNCLRHCKTFDQVEACRQCHSVFLYDYYEKCNSPYKH